MDFGAGVGEVVGIALAQQHRALDALCFWQLRRLGFRQLEHGANHAAALRVAVSPAPVLDELARSLHALVIDQARADLRPPETR